MADREKTIRGLEAHYSDQPCSECPYQGERYCTMELTSDALALLREQEARVLTLEEIRSGAAEVVWLEDADKPNVIPGIRFKLMDEDGDEAVAIHVMDGFIGPRLAVYGKKWRAWTSRPTPEQMRAVPWN